MEKKYYFRGLGLGIIVTAVIMGIALSGGRKELTDEEVITRAKALGMTENTRLLEPTEADGKQAGTEKPEEKEPEQDLIKEPEKEPEQDPIKEPVKEPIKEPTKEPSKTEGLSAGDGESKLSEKTETAEEAKPNKKSAADTNEMTKQDEDTGQKTPPEEAGRQKAAASVTIVSGDGSFTVAKKLEEAGLVSSASAYDDFLCQNGYDKKLRAGTFQVPADASEEQIARIVTGQQ